MHWQLKKEIFEAPQNLIDYYKDQKDHTNMIKYYKIAIQNNDSKAMINLGNYYQEQKYYELTVDTNNVMAMYNLALYYLNQKDYQNMIKYCLLAIRHGCINLLNILGEYYINNNNEKAKECLSVFCDNNKLTNQLSNKISSKWKKILLTHIFKFKEELHELENKNKQI